MATPYIPCTGAICTAKRISGNWRVISHFYDGLVIKCRIQSTATGKITSRFFYELTEIPSSSYKELNPFLERVTGLGPNDCDFLNDSFEVRNDNENVPPPKKRFKGKQSGLSS